MSRLNGKAEGRERNAPADRAAKVQRLAIRCFDLSRLLRQLRDENADCIKPNDFDFITELGVELAAYAAILQMNRARQIDWLSHTITLAEKTAKRILGVKGGES